jgi:hypothetical protein
LVRSVPLKRAEGSSDMDGGDKGHISLRELGSSLSDLAHVELERAAME